MSVLTDFVALEIENALKTLDKEEFINFTVDDMENMVRVEGKISKIDPKKVKLIKIEEIMENLK